MTRLVPLCLAPLLLAGCVTPPPEDIYSACKAISTRDWTARVERVKKGLLWDPDKVSLTVSGTVELPTGGYGLAIEPGALVRLDPPVQQVILRTTPPGGMATQAITEQRVTGSVPFERGAQSVSIRCGDGTIASIPVIDDRRPAGGAS